MKFAKLLLIPASIMFVNIAVAKEIYLTVPFHSQITKKDKIIADYDMNANSPKIECSSNYGPDVWVEFKYKDTNQQAMLPQILKTTGELSANESLADPVGTLKIRTGYRDKIDIYCQYKA